MSVNEEVVGDELDEVEKKWVLIVDDAHTMETYDLWFREDFARRRKDGATEIFARLGPTTRTARAGLSALRSAWLDDTPPDLVLLDHQLPDGPTETLTPSALFLMRDIVDVATAMERPVPKCVLWTAEYSDGLAFAFANRGGQHAIPRTMPDKDVMKLLWRVLLEDERWQHPLYKQPPLDIEPAVVEILPFLEADWPISEIAKVLGLTEAAVRSRKSDLREAIYAQLGHDNLLTGHGAGTRLAAMAQEHGHIWEPLAYWDD